jgi:hypothetical protein
MFAVFLGGGVGLGVVVGGRLTAGRAVLRYGMRLKVVESRRRKPEEARARAKLQLAAATCDYKARAIPIDSRKHHLFAPHTHTFTMQSTRAFNMLRQRAAPVFRAQQPVRGLRLQSSPKMRSPVPVSMTYQYTNTPMLTTSQKEEHSGSYPPS